MQPVLITHIPARITFVSVFIRVSALKHVSVSSTVPAEIRTAQIITTDVISHK